MNSKLSFFENNNLEEIQKLLRERILVLQSELADIKQKTSAFETVLRSNLEDEIVEEQELAVLYKKLQKAKKNKRLAQKRKGKNRKDVFGIIPVKDEKESLRYVEEQKERKRLYREAMMLTHPDLIQTTAIEMELATEITTKLIEIYQSGDLEKLQLIHAHISSGNAFVSLNSSIVTSTSVVNDRYLQKEIETLEVEIAKAKNKQTYLVLTTYENPFTFIDELRAFYLDRIFKLKKRTRNSHKFEL